ncbi:DNA helicase-2 / ATP-dependent DNA helicase PcrA [Pricia antarctica]|uniref:DNA 3'-5' helicase n=1 Tax=Pricia antarctica TaxID=641691 RepID=A0A1G7C6V7_9FLAO|nr:ATP-dependent helicase [Pricia antarctica]SDE35124.1 DNA helicase-2 / ATP-dependent DNA helicase PcrA [Pricia antarctica]
MISKTFQEKFNPSQQAAVSFTGQHALILAGAGTGKTRTIIGRAAYLIESGVSPSKIQILTFTKKAANEIVERVRSQFPESTAISLKGSTFHSWCNQLIVKYPNLFGASTYTVIDQDDQLSIMKMVCGEYKEDFGRLRLKPQQLIDLYSFARNTRKNLTESIRILLFKDRKDRETEYEITQQRPYIGNLLKAYQSKKGNSKYLDYDDLLLAVSTQLHQNEEARRILAMDLEHLLVDEMQDTNPLQWELLKPFAQVCRLYCVGDDAQSIYSFRGADFRNVHSFKERVPDSTVLKLNINYRSTQHILDLANWLLARSPIKYDKKLVSNITEGSFPVVMNVSDQWQESSWVAEEILNGFQQDDKFFGDHLVLSRSQYYTKTLQAVFIRKKIPFVTYGGRKFLEAAHIKDVVAVLRILNNPFDEIAWVRFLTFWDGIGDVRASRALGNIVAGDGSRPIGTLVKDALPGQDGEKIGDLIGELELSKGDVGQLVTKTFEAMELGLAYKYRKDWQEKRKADFEVLQLLAKSYGSLGEFIGEGLLDNAANLNKSHVLSGSELSPSEDRDHVIISTIHSAKGLEADTCFVLNVSPKVFPSTRTLHDPEAIEEDRRLLYVALTRAKNRLFITRNIDSIQALTKGDEIINEAKDIPTESYFLSDLPDSLVEQRTYEHTFDKPRDVGTPNTMDLSSGMDFS